MLEINQAPRVRSAEGCYELRELVGIDYERATAVIQDALVPQIPLAATAEQEDPGHYSLVFAPA